MKTLCIDARMAFSSGIGTFIRELVPLLNQYPFKVILLVKDLDQKWCNGIEQIVFNAPIYSIKEQIQFPYKIPHCDLFWSPHYNVPFLGIRAKKRCVTIHDVCHLVYGHFGQRMYAKTLVTRALQSDNVITDSQFSSSEIRRFFPRSKEIRVVPIGVNQTQFRKQWNTKTLEKYKLDKKFILYVGNAKKHKNVETFLRALDYISIPDLECIIVGKFQSQIHTKNVRVLESVTNDELPVLYSMAEAFVFPSLYEGFGLPPLEAMACGCPTIVSNAASLPEVCGNASLYFDPMSSQSLADALFKVLTNIQLKNALIQKGKERAQEFVWTKAAEKYRRLFEEL